MRIAIIGGGASGLVAAYLLSNRHEVHLYERAPNLGGHVRTLGQNVSADKLPPGKVTENGPLGFQVSTSPTFIRLLKELEIPTISCALGSNLFLHDHEYYLRQDLQHWRRRFIEPQTGGIETGIALIRFLIKTRPSLTHRYGHKYLGEVLPTLPYLRDWLRCIVMMGYSTPVDRVDSLPVSQVASTLRQGFLHGEWVFIPGGVYSYQAKILSRFNGRVFLNSRVENVFRNEFGETLSVNGKKTPQYDKLIVATPPGTVFSMLDRPTETERRFFAAWDQDIPFRTIAHTDLTMYHDKKTMRPTVADYFQRGKTFGYNCCVSSLYTNTGEFNFSYNMDDLIAPEKQLDSHEHRVPAYSHAVLHHREELISSNGAEHTYYAGAYLGIGLHEAAVSSAYQVERLLEDHQSNGTKIPQQRSL